MFEHITQEVLEKRMLKRVSPKFDKREGSIIYDATAPISFELKEAYIMADTIIKETFASTSSREFLKLRAKEFSMTPRPATPAEMKGVFSKDVEIGTRFNFGKYNFVVVEALDSEEHSYILKSETPGALCNSCIGNITPIEPIEKLESARLVEIIVPGTDEEETEAFRERFLTSLKSKAYGGNNADYKEKTLAIAGVGGSKNYRTWQGGGTVKVVIIDSNFNKPSEELIQKVQNILDPTPQGEGYGLAPIGHKVTVVGATEVPLTIQATVQLESGYAVDNVQSMIEKAISEYLLLQRKEWASHNEKDGITIRTAFIIAKILNVKHVADVINVRVNGNANKITLTSEQIPILSKLMLGG